ncbi:MAG: 50S ribosomal protein L17 [Acidobacteria bacterium]|nr:50S ribosomal protein L17 [Acidobacteriota bacterium]MCZ6751336.1 50S ribosomal protein L17 [Acidobacteriota bacterium]
MRHLKAGWKLGRNTSHRKALLRNLVTSLLERERIVTTVVKAKALRPLAEKMITLGKAESLHARRQAAAFLMTPVSVKKLFDSLSARFAQQNGGYVRITRVGWRAGDGADMALVELVGSELKEKAPAKKKKKEKA